jgi:tetratricopeptide (TPR) repeat protein
MRNWASAAGFFLVVQFGLSTVAPVMATEPGPVAKSAQTLIEQAREARAQGRSASAMAQFVEAASLSPRDPFPWIEAGRAALAVDDNDLALSYFQRAKDLDQNSIDARVGHASALSALAKHDLALAAWRALAAVLSDRPGIKMGLARAEYDSGNVKLAKKLFAETLKADPSSIENRLLFARFQIDSRSPKPAIQTLSNLLKSSPTSLDALMLRANAYDWAKQWSRGDADAEAALGAAPRSADIRYARGVRALSIDDYDPAIVEFSKALELDPAHVFARIKRAQANNSLNKQDAALRDLHAANAARPNLALILRTRGQAYLALDDYLLARDFLDAAIALDPKDDDAKQARTTVLQRLGETSVSETTSDPKLK